MLDIVINLKWPEVEITTMIFTKEENMMILQLELWLNLEQKKKKRKNRRKKSQNNNKQLHFKIKQVKILNKVASQKKHFKKQFLCLQNLDNNTNLNQIIKAKVNKMMILIFLAIILPLINLKITNNNSSNNKVTKIITMMILIGEV